MSRKANDFYPTPEPLALAITQHLAELLPYPVGVIEPSAGTGAFVKASKQVWPKAFVHAVEIIPNLRPELEAAGADTVIIRDWEDCCKAVQLIPGALILGNPPFSLAERHIRAGLGILNHGDYIAMLLRMSFFGSFDRVPFWIEFPTRYMIPLVPRPNYVVGGNANNSEYAVFVWQAGPFLDKSEILPPLVWRQQKHKGKKRKNG